MRKLKGKDQSFRRGRREFAKQLAVAAATPLVAKAGDAPAAEAAATQQAQPQTSPFTAQAEALAEVVRRRYPEYLTKEQLEAVKRSIERSLRGGDTLNKFELHNSDEPAFTFSADPPEPFADAGGEDQEREREEKRVREGSRKKKLQPRRP